MKQMADFCLKWGIHSVKITQSNPYALMWRNQKQEAPNEHKLWNLLAPPCADPDEAQWCNAWREFAPFDVLSERTEGI